MKDYDAMATIRQKKAVDILARYSKENKPTTAGEVLLEANYSKSVAKNPIQVFGSQGFQKYLSSKDERPIIDKWMDWALSDSDKRVAMEAGKEIMKLKDRYPAQKSKVIGLFDIVEQLDKDDDNV